MVPLANGCVDDFRTGGGCIKLPARPIFFPRIDDCHCDRVYSSLTTIHWFDHGYVGKQPVPWKKYCAEYWLKNSRRACCHNVTEIFNVENDIKPFPNKPLF